MAYIRAIGKDIIISNFLLKPCNRITWFYPITDKCKNSIVLYFKKQGYSIDICKEEYILYEDDLYIWLSDTGNIQGIDYDCLYCGGDSFDIVINGKEYNICLKEDKLYEIVIGNHYNKSRIIKAKPEKPVTK
jgi:hypothetical protein